MIELIVVIVVIGVLAAMGAAFIIKPVEGYVNLARRAELVDAGEHALRLMQRDVRNALPNSIRIKSEGNGNGMVLEIIPIIRAGRYRQSPAPGMGGNPDCRLQFNTEDTSFASTSDLGTKVESGQQVVISNWTSSGDEANAYFGDNRTGILDVIQSDTACNGEDRLGISPKKFPFSSDRQRFYTVGNPVAYLCDTSSHTLMRYTGYDFHSDQNTVDTDSKIGNSGGNGALVTRHLVGCGMIYDPGAPERGGLVTLDLTLSDTGSNEEIRLLHQVHVDNAP